MVCTQGSQSLALGLTLSAAPQLVTGWTPQSNLTKELSQFWFCAKLYGHD